MTDFGTETAPPPVSDLLDAFEAVAREAPGKAALVGLRGAEPDGEQVVWTRRELADDLRATAALLEAEGASPGRPLGILLPTLPETHLLLWAGLQACDVGLINPLLRREHIARLITAMSIGVLAHPSRSLDPERWAIAQALAAEDADLRLLEVGPGSAFMERLRSTPPRGAGRGAGGSALFHTGGTTGRPKIAPLSRSNILAVSDMLRETLAFTAADIFVCPLPLFHIAGAVVGGLAPLLSGSCVVMPAPGGLRDPGVVAAFWRVVAAHRATMLVAVPTALAALTNVPVDGADLSSLQYVLTGTAPLPPETARRFTALTGKPVHTGYGMTETSGGIAYVPRTAPARPASVGPALPNLELRVMCDGRSSSGKVGEVQVRGPNVFAGYLAPADPALTRDGWFATGDLGSLDADGWLTLTGRSKDLIIRGGHNIDPAVIEDAAGEHAGVAVAAAVGQIDDYAGEVPVLYVQLRPGAGDAEAAKAQIIELLDKTIAEPPARPRVVQVLPELPLTAVGKVYKPALRALAAHTRLSALLEEEGLFAGPGRLTVDPDEGGRLLVRVRLAENESGAAERLRSRLGLFPVTALVSVGREG
jgi:fatty-acyl-CoA synthase